jgi:aryl carrier-like protein
VLFFVLWFDSLGLTADDLTPMGVDFAESYLAAVPTLGTWVKTFLTFMIKN